METHEKVTRVWEAVFPGIPPREADKAVIALMIAQRGPHQPYEIVTEYIWDHILGEPDDVDVDALEAKVRMAWEGK